MGTDSIKSVSVRRMAGMRPPKGLRDVELLLDAVTLMYYGRMVHLLQFHSRI